MCCYFNLWLKVSRKQCSRGLNARKRKVETLGAAQNFSKTLIVMHVLFNEMLREGVALRVLDVERVEGAA